VQVHSKAAEENKILKPSGAVTYSCSITQQIIRDKFHLPSTKPLLRQISLCIINAMQT